MPDVRSLEPDDWPTLRDIRLAALRDSPDLFLSTYAKEKHYDEEKWHSEFVRGTWNVCFREDEPMGLVGVTRDPGSPADTRHLEYLWVAPASRRRGVAGHMLKIVLDQLRMTGIRTAFLWVLDGNERPGRFEERLQMDLI